MECYCSGYSSIAAIVIDEGIRGRGERLLVQLCGMAREPKSHPPGAIVASDPQTEAFVRGLVERGEAAKPDGSGKLPPGATHEIVGETETGLPIVVRRRFSAF
jgi:hypothetical protein